MADDPTALGTQLRGQMEASAGATFIGPDARTLTYTFDGEATFPKPYLTVAFDGFLSGEAARANMFLFVMQYAFDIHGNSVRLTRSMNPDPSDSFPPGSILMWRGEGGPPQFGVDGDGFWSCTLTYLLLPAFARVVG